MFLGHGVTVINFDEATNKLSSKNNFLSANNVHSTLNQMIIEESSKSENIDDDNNIQKDNQRFLYSKNNQPASRKIRIYNDAPNKVEAVQQVDIAKKSVISHKLRDTIILNKRLRKRIIMQSYKSWLRKDGHDYNINTYIDFPEGQIKLLYNNSMIDHNMHKEKILLYGLYKSFKDRRPCECPYKSTKLLTHVNHGSAIFPRKNISPSLHKKCICEHFSIAKSPLRTKLH